MLDLLYSSTIKFKINFSCFGQMIPKIPVLNNENVDIFRKKLQRNMLAGPFVNIIICAISGLIVLMTNNTYAWIVLFVNLFMVIQCGTENRYALGDFIAYNKIKTDNTVFVRIINTFYLQDVDKKQKNEK